MSATDTEREDMEIMAQARNRVAYDGYRNSLVEWTMSDEWTRPSLSQEIRGKIRRAGQKTTVVCNSCEGEING